MIGENVVRYNAKLFNPLDIDEYSSFYHSQIFPGIIIAVGKSGMTLRTRKMCRKYCITDEASHAHNKKSQQSAVPIIMLNVANAGENC